MQSSIELPNFHIIKPKRNRPMETIVAGIDSETFRGEPITIQIYSDEEPKLNKILWITGNSACAELFKFLSRTIKTGYYRFYCHNLKFDAISFFWNMKQDLIDITGFEFTQAGWTISGYYGQPTFFTATKKGARIDFVDSYLWFSTSLAQAAKVYCPELPKLPMPKGLGNKRFTKKDHDFVDYAMQDAIIGARLGRMIDDMHTQLDIKPSLSLASMSASVFSNHFLKHEICQVPHKFLRGAVYAYHGGKNNVITGAAPAWHMDINSYDVSSAYPYSMTQLPGYADVSNYKEWKRGHSRIRRVPDDGVYLISGKVSNCEWPSLFHHDFSPIKGESIKDVWTTGYELNEALRTREIKLTSLKGLYYDAPDSEDRPLKRFADHFYSAKESAKDDVQKFRNKIVVNSLYGKFIQTKEVYADDGSGNVIRQKVAAGMFQPMIAGTITGHTRSIMHYLEHELEAIHTATDGIYTYNHPNKLKLPKKGLGSLKYEGSGTLALVRNKLYVLYAEDGKIFSQHFKDKMIKKYARHGFMGTLSDLEAFLAFGKRKYRINKPNTLRDALNRGLTPNEFTVREYTLKAGNMKVYEDG